MKGFRHIKGFTLLECLVALLVLSGVLLGTNLLIRQISKLDIVLQRKDYQDWLVFLIQIENELNEAEFVSIQDNRLVYEKNGHRYVIEQYQTMIRKRREIGGHQPMLMEVKYFEFIEEQTFIVFMAEFENGDQEYAKWSKT